MRFWLLLSLLLATAPAAQAAVNSTLPQANDNAWDVCRDTSKLAAFRGPGQPARRHRRLQGGARDRSDDRHRPAGPRPPRALSAATGGAVRSRFRYPLEVRR